MRTTTATEPEARMRNPVHPGEFIRAEILEPLDLTVTAAAQVLKSRGPRSRACSTARRISPATWPCASRRRSGSGWRR